MVGPRAPSRDGPGAPRRRASGDSLIGWHLDEVYLKIEERMAIFGARWTPRARFSTFWFMMSLDALL
jgi:hypothetical protein